VAGVVHSGVPRRRRSTRTPLCSAAAAAAQASRRHGTARPGQQQHDESKQKTATEQSAHSATHNRFELLLDIVMMKGSSN
jgi:hypothetical protein